MSGLQSDIDGVKNSFSSWDGCMAHDYCKYPVIAAIIVGSLIALSVLFCIVRCCCCGLECCCGVCSCCNACCPSPRNRRDKPSKYADGPLPYSNNTGYQPQPPPVYGGPAQYAQFDNGPKAAVHADSLPAMPTWANATSHRVADDSHEEAVELNHMNAHDEAKAPMLAHQAPPPAVTSDAFAAGAMPPSPYHDSHGYAGHAYEDEYAQEELHDQFNHSNGMAATAASYGRDHIPNQYAQQQQYGSHDQYGQTNYEYGGVGQDAHNQGYQGQSYGQAQAQTTYGIAGAPASRLSPPAHEPSPPPQAYSHSPVPPQQGYSSHSPPTSTTPLPGALLSGANSRAPPQQSYQAYGSAYSQPQPKPQFTAYSPSSDVATARSEPPSYQGPAGAGHDQ